ncbi:MAG TPA: hypothetical protein VMM13_05430 [Euzebya sp.]|nr:hypothetical protein [Euzebya sp.]
MAVEATTDITDRFVTALADGRTMLTLPPAAGGPLVEMLDEALAVEGTWGPGDQVGVVAEAPDGTGCATEEDG